MAVSMAISGYKPHEIGVFNERHEQLPFLKKALRRKIEAAVDEYGVEWVVISGQAGVELWAGEAVIDMKRDGFHIQLAVLAPFQQQEERYQEAVKELYQTVWQESDYQAWITERPYESPAQLKQKNQFIVAKTDLMLLLYDTEKPGTPSFYLEAAEARQEQDGYPVIYITPDDIEDAVRDELDDWN
ncbi:SLOG family protein [Alkalicoccus luteus]|uniref:SLOG family protein n=1 Tax=Alkalicoccus luteus TaxID=1237094 RepID=UPI004033280F